MKTKILCVVLFSSILSINTFAMGARRSTSGSSSSSTTTDTTTIPLPTISMGPDLSIESYLDSSSLIATNVDQYESSSELQKVRTLVNEDNVDKCFDDLGPHDLFADQVSYFILKMMKDTSPKVGVIGSYYGTSSNDAKYFPVSFIRHPLCNVTTSTLSTTINSSKVPSSATITKINNFVSKANLLRSEAINGNLKSKKDLLNLWGHFYSCLAYTESLTSADSSKSNSVASKYAPTNYRRPAGVEFYEDPAQDAASKLNIGMFQFTPNSSGNVQACIRAWNEMTSTHASCQISQTASQGELIKALGSSYQSFNTFCGVHKMIQTFGIQVNTTMTSATHPNNLVNGKLKPQEERCVSPHFASGKAYVHFGPFMNSTGSNLTELMTCVEKSQN
jgi:hypothetical protein